MNGVGYLIRHGSTEHNEKGLTRGLTDIPLSHDGIHEAHRIGQHLRDKKITSLKSSDLERGRHTAFLVGAHTGAEHTPSHGLRPIDLGEFTGVPTDKVKEHITRLIADQPHQKFPGGESYNDWLNKVWPETREFLLEILRGKRPARVIHGTHANMFHALIHGDGQRLSREILRNQPVQKPGEIWTVWHDGKKFSYEGPLNKVHPKQAGAGS